ncbi:MAG: hypothetical protein JWL77_7168, partial [Chthonomonadaceae bacterium]|nr:hypothetical protein [Chthonomonadaceae bacterium]
QNVVNKTPCSKNKSYHYHDKITPISYPLYFFVWCFILLSYLIVIVCSSHLCYWYVVSQHCIMKLTSLTEPSYQYFTKTFLLLKSAFLSSFVFILFNPLSVDFFSKFVFRMALSFPLSLSFVPLLLPSLHRRCSSTIAAACTLLALLLLA